MISINPLDIVRRTPKTNCGKCGHLTCLAFAAAVAKTGEKPSQCPFIDLHGLNVGPPSSLVHDIDGLTKERDPQLIQHLKNKIASLDFAVIAKALGAICPRNHPDTLFFSYLGREVRLSKNGVFIDQDQPEDPRDQILLYNYVSSKGGRSPDYTWVGMESLPNSISKIKTLATYCENRLAEMFTSQHPEHILELIKQLGGKHDQGSSATLAFIIPVLPKVPHFLLFWDQEPEDGFAAKVKILFDHHVLNFLDLESLVFSAERLADRIFDLM